MLEVAEIIRRHGAAVRAALGSRLLPSQARALRDLVACRTAACGGQLTQCSACGGQVYRYHSCRNRHCPKCRGDQTARWLERHQARLLPCPHYLITFTLPGGVARARLRPPGRRLRRADAVARRRRSKRSPPTRASSARSSAASRSSTRGRAPCSIIRTSICIVTAGGLSADRTQWIAPKHPAFLVPVRALSVILRAKMCAALRRAGLLDQVPPAVWTTPWVVHAQPAGRWRRGSSTTWRAISSASRSPTVDSSRSTTTRSRFGIVTTGRRRSGASPSPASSFCAASCSTSSRARCTKVRYYGLWSATRRKDLDLARTLLETERAPRIPRCRRRRSRPPRSAPAPALSLSAVSRGHADAGRDPASCTGRSLHDRDARDDHTTPLSATCAPHVVGVVCVRPVVRPRGRRTGPPRAPLMTCPCVEDGCFVAQRSPRRPRPTAASRAVGPFKLQ